MEKFSVGGRERTRECQSHVISSNGCCWAAALTELIFLSAALSSFCETKLNKIEVKGIWVVWAAPEV